MHSIIFVVESFELQNRCLKKNLLLFTIIIAVYQVDIWNMIEAFRENGLNSVDAQHDLGISRLEAVLSTVFTQLNKRLPPPQHVNVEECVGLTLSWLLNTYDRSVRFGLQKACAKETTGRG